MNRILFLMAMVSLAGVVHAQPRLCSKLLRVDSDANDPIFEVAKMFIEYKSLSVNSPTWSLKQAELSRILESGRQRDAQFNQKLREAVNELRLGRREVSKKDVDQNREASRERRPPEKKVTSYNNYSLIENGIPDRRYGLSLKMISSKEFIIIRINKEIDFFTKDAQGNYSKSSTLTDMMHYAGTPLPMAISENLLFVATEGMPGSRLYFRGPKGWGNRGSYFINDAAAVNSISATEFLVLRHDSLELYQIDMATKRKRVLGKIVEEGLGPFGFSYDQIVNIKREVFFIDSEGALRKTSLEQMKAKVKGVPETVLENVERIEKLDEDGRVIVTFRDNSNVIYKLNDKNKLVRIKKVPEKFMAYFGNLPNGDLIFAGDNNYDLWILPAHAENDFSQAYKTFEGEGIIYGVQALNNTDLIVEFGGITPELIRREIYEIEPTEN